MNSLVVKETPHAVSSHPASSMITNKPRILCLKTFILSALDGDGTSTVVYVAYDRSPVYRVGVNTMLLKPQRIFVNRVTAFTMIIHK